MQHTHGPPLSPLGATACVRQHPQIPNLPFAFSLGRLNKAATRLLGFVRAQTRSEPRRAAPRRAAPRRAARRARVVPVRAVPRQQAVADAPLAPHSVGIPCAEAEHAHHVVRHAGQNLRPRAQHVVFAHSELWAAVVVEEAEPPREPSVRVDRLAVVGPGAMPAAAGRLGFIKQPKRLVLTDGRHTRCRCLLARTAALRRRLVRHPQPPRPTGGDHSDGYQGQRASCANASNFRTLRAVIENQRSV